MGLFDWMRLRRRPSADQAALSEFIETRAAFLVQKTIYEYARARASVHSIEMFKEEAFVRAVNYASWTGLPDGLVWEALMIEGQLRTLVGEHREALLEGLLGLIDGIVARQPTPEVLPAGFWTAAGAEIAARIRRGAFAAKKPVNEIPLADLDAFFARMPIHERLRGRDYQAVGNSLRAHLVNHSEEFAERFDQAALAEVLIAAGQTRLAVST